MPDLQPLFSHIYDYTWGVLLEGWCKPRKIDLMLAMKRFVDGLPGHRAKAIPQYPKLAALRLISNALSCSAFLSS